MADLGIDREFELKMEEMMDYVTTHLTKLMEEYKEEYCDEVDSHLGLTILLSGVVKTAAEIGLHLDLSRPAFDDFVKGHIDAMTERYKDSEADVSWEVGH